MNPLDERTIRSKRKKVKLIIHGIRDVEFDAVKLSHEDMDWYTRYSRRKPFLTLWGIMEDVDDESKKYMVLTSEETGFCYCYPVNIH